MTIAYTKRAIVSTEYRENVEGNTTGKESQGVFITLQSYGFERTSFLT